jgi:outer membrane protein assembly factor BamA
VHGFRVGADVAWLQTNVGTGTQSDFPNTEDVFTDEAAPGLESQPNYLRTDIFAEFDWRDKKGIPRRGGYYRVDYAIHSASGAQRFSFRRFQGDFEQYIPFTRGHRVIAARFAFSFDDPESGHRVPFYMQRTLGGPTDLRGFRPFRFRDVNQIVLNAEYRWRAWAPLEMAAFVDAGTVFGDGADFSLNDLETSYGFGFRLHTTKTTLFRLDVGTSREGSQVFATIGASFK